MSEQNKIDELLPCPFCGGGDVDPHGWLNGEGEHGPQCMGCGATGENADAWNARASLPVGVPDGYALVPVEPTFEMRKAVWEKHFCSDEGATTIYRAMLAAAPAATSLPAAESAVEEVPIAVLNAGWAALSDQGIDPETVEMLPIYQAMSAAISAQDVSVPRELPGIADRLERFIETVRGCERLASDYSGSLDGVDEHGGDDHEDPICAVFHRLYYAMFEGDKLLTELRALLNGGEA